jgi:alkylation response protein AidB-like acyl-CoA dehydrogenase
MDLRLTDEQRQLVDSYSALLARHATSEHVRAAEEVGHDPELWKRLAELGAVPMAVPEEAGGWGASMVDLALVAEQLGRVAAPAPVIECQIAARLLASIGTGASVAALTSAIDGSRLITFAPRSVDGGLAALVPAGSIADAAVVRSDDQVLLVDLGDAHRRVGNIGSMPVADVRPGDDATVLATGPEAVAAHDRAIDEWLSLTAAALVGVGARGLELGVDYGKERLVGGVPIGSFQAIAHPLANSATALDGARLLALESAWAHAEEPTRASELSAMAFAFAYESARDATLHSLRVHGGYGFMMEYDIQLFYRRARAWANVFGEPTSLYRRVADRRYGAAVVS